jgi:hypothetical protein
VFNYLEVDETVMGHDYQILKMVPLDTFIIFARYLCIIHCYQQYVAMSNREQYLLYLVAIVYISIMHSTRAKYLVTFI